MDKEKFNIYCVFCFLLCTFVYAHNVREFEVLETESNEQTLSKTSRIRRSTDTKCQEQENNFLQEILSENGQKTIIDKHEFGNETNYSLALAWAGTHGDLLIVTTDQTDVSKSSSVYRSEDYGRTFEQCKGVLESAKIRKHDGLQRNPHDPFMLYLIGFGPDSKTILYITEDGGKKFEKVTLDFYIDGEILVHPDPDHKTRLLASAANQHIFGMALGVGKEKKSKTRKTLYVSDDNGRHWKRIASDVQSYRWGTVKGDNPTTIYATVDPASTHPFVSMFVQVVYELRKSTNSGTRWDTLLDNVLSFGHQGEFLYASVITKGAMSGKRRMKVSKNGGKSWDEAQLPTITGDRFYSVLDMRESLVFMHVDNPGDTGHGTLYTSGKDGIVYSESLQKHLYPNYGDVTDFYRVDSLEGVYIASQMRDDNSIQSVITYNRGADWQPLPRPTGADCKNELKACNLQIHGSYSLSRGVIAKQPLSVKSALGIVLVHGHVADALQTTPPDVFITSDGGYTWRKALNGPHDYQIADSGSLIVAVPAGDKKPKVIKFSTDEGNCWHEYKFIKNDNDTIYLTGLLTEPGSKSATVSIWGYRVRDRVWVTYIIDFEKVLKRQCEDKDYESWTAHSLLRKNEAENVQGCLLGRKAVFERLKQDSWCYNGINHENKKAESTCVCTREDYECDYGYYRPERQDQCIKNSKLKTKEIDICIRGHEEEIVSEGYRKIPGDKCSGGFSPQTKKINLTIRCKEGSKDIIKSEEIPPSQVQPEQHTKSNTVLVVVITIVLLLGAIIGAYFVQKYIVLRRHRVVYKYSLLQQDDGRDNEYENALSSMKPVVYQDSDDDEELNSPAVPRSATNGNPPKKHPNYNTVKSYHDDSDVDMLN